MGAGNINGQFADQDSYLLSALVKTANSNQADLNVIIQEQDFLNATSAYQQQSAVTSNPVNRIPNVTQVAQTTVGESQNVPDRTPISEE